jgi:hypothetical protein
VDEKRRQIGVFLLSRERFVPNTSIRCQAQRARLYGAAAHEKAIGLLEQSAAAVMQQIIQSRTVPKRFSEAHTTLLNFLVFQMLRTPTAASELVEAMHQASGLLASLEPRAAATAARLTPTPQQAQQISLRGLINAPVAMDLCYKLLIAPPGVTFILSDHPVVPYNQFLERRRHPSSGVGLAIKGLQIFAPIAPGTCLVLYDYDTYRVGGRSLRGVQIQVTRADVELLNTLQILNAGEHLYIGRGFAESALRRLVARGSPFRRAARSLALQVHQGNTLDGRDGIGILSTRNDIRIGLELSVISELPSARFEYDPRDVVPARNPEMLDHHIRRIGLDRPRRTRLTPE